MVDTKGQHPCTSRLHLYEVQMLWTRGTEQEQQQRTGSHNRHALFRSAWRGFNWQVSVKLFVNLSQVPL